MSGLLSAAVEALHLKGLHFAGGLQIEDFVVAREEGVDAGGGVHGVSQVCEAFHQNNKLDRPRKRSDVSQRSIKDSQRGEYIIQLPLASEHTARNPSSVRSLNRGLTPYVSLPRKTFLLAVSSRIKAKTPSRREAIFWMPKRS